MRRHKRKNKLTSIQIERFVTSSAQAHRALLPYLRALKPLSPQYRAIRDISLALREAIHIVSGKEPPWSATGPSAMRADPPQPENAVAPKSDGSD